MFIKNFFMKIILLLEIDNYIILSFEKKYYMFQIYMCIFKGFEQVDYEYIFKVNLMVQ